MVTAQPDFGEVGELMIPSDQVRRQMTMVVINRLTLGVPMVKFAGLLGAQEKIVVDEGTGCHGRK
jgi:hypothetical protein